MATKAQKVQSEEQRKGGAGRDNPRVAKKKAKKADWSHEKGHAASKATHALEDTTPGKRPSRVSTRGTSNRAKADSARNVTEETRKGAPTNLARKSRAKAVKVRGSGK